MRYRWLFAWLPVALLAGLTAVPFWLAFGPGTRRCIVSVSRLAVAILGRSSEMLCRGIFAVAAIVGVALVLWAVREALATRRRAGTPSRA